MCQWPLPRALRLVVKEWLRHLGQLSLVRLLMAAKESLSASFKPNTMHCIHQNFFNFRILDKY